jgi:hypothetical protein
MLLLIRREFTVIVRSRCLGFHREAFPTSICYSLSASHVDERSIGVADDGGEIFDRQTSFGGNLLSGRPEALIG